MLGFYYFKVIGKCGRVLKNEKEQIYTFQSKCSRALEIKMLTCNRQSYSNTVMIQI